MTLRAVWLILKTGILPGKLNRNVIVYKPCFLDLIYIIIFTPEIDFVIQRNGKLIPIEVKSADNTKAKSLKVYMETYKPDYAVSIFYLIDSDQP
mgnify:CR=1 FL=1